MEAESKARPPLFTGSLNLSIQGRSPDGVQRIDHILSSKQSGPSQAAWIEVVNTVAADLARLIGYEVTIGWRPGAAVKAALAAEPAAGERAFDPRLDPHLDLPVEAL